MGRLFKLQFLGPLALFVATLCAELAVRAQRDVVTVAALEAEFLQLRLKRVERELASVPSGEKERLAKQRQELQTELKRAMGRAIEASASDRDP